MPDSKNKNGLTNDEWEALYDALSNLKLPTVDTIHKDLYGFKYTPSKGAKTIDKIAVSILTHKNGELVKKVVMDSLRDIKYLGKPLGGYILKIANENVDFENLEKILTEAENFQILEKNPLRFSYKYIKAKLDIYSEGEHPPFYKRSNKINVRIDKSKKRVYVEDTQPSMLKKIKPILQNSLYLETKGVEDDTEMDMDYAINSRIKFQKFVNDVRVIFTVNYAQYVNEQEMSKSEPFKENLNKFKTLDGYSKFLKRFKGYDFEDQQKYFELMGLKPESNGEYNFDNSIAKIEDTLLHDDFQKAINEINRSVVVKGYEINTRYIRTRIMGKELKQRYEWTEKFDKLNIGCIQKDVYDEKLLKEFSEVSGILVGIKGNLYYRGSNIEYSLKHGKSDGTISPTHVSLKITKGVENYKDRHLLKDAHDAFLWPYERIFLQ
ncbi:hypothetical protein [Methanococcus maripaludis]|uniref:hypothetical protein n=1 Tax=Methanococcus maripaludis TaxID=39152 RepID=UPI000CF224A5|nr:hypothetical protein [Methanococcus maripaludis]